MEYNYKTKIQPLLNERFRAKYCNNLKGKETINSEGLTYLSHQKGMWKLESEIIQFPTKENDCTCICKATLGGYDYDPITDKIREVTYTEIGDASPKNCTSQTASSFIRMASTRALARVMRKYVNMDVVTVEEIDPPVSEDQLGKMKAIVKAKSINPKTFVDLLRQNFGTENHTELSYTEAEYFIKVLESL